MESYKKYGQQMPTPTLHIYKKDWPEASLKDQVLRLAKMADDTVRSGGIESWRLGIVFHGFDDLHAAELSHAFTRAYVIAQNGPGANRTDLLALRTTLINWVNHKENDQVPTHIDGFGDMGLLRIKTNNSIVLALPILPMREIPCDEIKTGLSNTKNLGLLPEGMQPGKTGQ
jgi:hypothetical protein